MPSKLKSPYLHVTLEPLTQSSFFQYGHVVANPNRHQPGTTAEYTTVVANQGSATKYLEVTDLTNHYGLAPSKKPAKPSINIFSCQPRQLRVSDVSLRSPLPEVVPKHFFDVRILERHPYTSQTFIPLGRSVEAWPSQYLVIVAPTLPTSKRQQLRPAPFPTPDAPEQKRSLEDLFSRARPSPFTNEAVPPPGHREPRATTGSNQPRGAGMPDLKNIRAYVASGDQAVTYGPGTWHAPMVVLGPEAIDFVVLQYMNGVGIEDCQEVEIESSEGQGVSVCVDELGEDVLGSAGVSPKL